MAVLEDNTKIGPMTALQAFTAGLSNLLGYFRYASGGSQTLRNRAPTAGQMAQMLTAGRGAPVSINYTFSTTTTDADPGAGILRLNQATQNTATVIRADLVDWLAQDQTTVLATLGASSNTIKGQLKLYKADDATKWLLFNVTALATPSGYRNISVVNIASSAASPFVDGDPLTLVFTQSGDVGLSANLRLFPRLPPPTGLKLWLDAGFGLHTNTSLTALTVTNGASIAGWQDRSPSALNPTQSTSGDRPTLNTAYWFGRPSLAFDGSIPSTFIQASGLTPKLNDLTVCFIVASGYFTGGAAFPVQLNTSGDLNFLLRGASEAAAGSGQFETDIYSNQLSGYVRGHLPLWFPVTAITWRFRPDGIRIRSGRLTHDVAISVPATALTSASAYIGGGSGAYFGGLYRHLLMYNSLPDDDLDELHEWALGQCYPWPWGGSAAPLVVFDGNSIPAGAFTTNQSNAYPARLKDGVLTDWDFQTACVPSRTTAENVLDGANRVDALYDPTRSRNVCVIQEVFNHTSGGANAATAFASLQSYVTDRRAVGWEVVVVTPSGTSQGNNGTNITVAASIRSTWGTSGVVRYADLAADANIGTGASSIGSGNANFADSVHLSDAGHAIAASILGPAILSR